MSLSRQLSSLNHVKVDAYAAKTVHFVVRQQPTPAGDFTIDSKRRTLYGPPFAFLWGNKMAHQKQRGAQRTNSLSFQHKLRMTAARTLPSGSPDETAGNGTARLNGQQLL